MVVGSATRDLDATDPRGWRPGGGVSYGALLLARLGVRVGVVVGLDPVAAAAGEPTALRAAGVEVVAVPLRRGPVFENREGPSGRRQRCLERSDALPVDALPPAWRGASAFLFAPVAAELGPEWGAVPDEAALVGLGWQGLLRGLVPGRSPRRLVPRPGPLQARADVTALSREDLPAGARRHSGEALERLLTRPGQALAVTAGASGGVIVWRSDTRRLQGRRWDAVAPRRVVDPTGAGDVFLAALLAARLVLGWAPEAAPASLRFAATAASLSVEGEGLLGVPDLLAIRHRLREVRRT